MTIDTGQPRRGLRAEIFRGPFGPCSNGGISAAHSFVTIVDEKIDGPFTPSDTAPEVRIVRRRIAGENVIHLEPVDRPAGAMVGPMMGGCYVATSDSCFGQAVGFYGAVALHDRFETREQYASYD